MYSMDEMAAQSILPVTSAVFLSGEDNRMSCWLVNVVMVTSYMCQIIIVMCEPNPEWVFRIYIFFYYFCPERAA